MASSSHHTFLTGNPLFPFNNHQSKNPHQGLSSVSCRSSMRKEEPEATKHVTDHNPNSNFFHCVTDGTMYAYG